MKIRRLDIFGFKSFMARTKLRFDDGITGIVGPNGCGKSNIVDAIRWVMGEQSSRLLRGKAMEDVIFAGAESKAPMGMAEVEITFENDGQNVPPAYSATRDISVTRRLYRSGESEYLINRTQCRLLDVHELFMGTGVGTKAYSIIGQGQIGLLVTQKPSERRNLIEEAAGISKYRARKKAAERKMEQTRQNLLRVADVVAEIKRNMSTLQRQARKAARYHKIRDELREIELYAASHRYLELQAVLRHLSSKRGRLATRETELQVLQSSLDAVVEQDKVLLLDEERKLAAVQEALHGTDNQIRLSEQNIEFLTREVSALTTRGQQAAAEIEVLRGTLGRTAQDMQASEKELAGLDDVATNASFRLQEKEDAHEEQAERVARLEAAIDQELQTQVRKRENAAHLRSKVANFDQRLQDIEGRLAQAQAEGRVLCEQEASKRKQEQDRGDRLAELRRRQQALLDRRSVEEERLVEAKALLGTTEAKAMALREEINARKSRLDSLREIERNYEGCQIGVRKVMQSASEIEKDDRIVGLVADILRSPPQYETAVQAVLGERLQCVVVGSHETGIAAVDFLKREAEGRSSFIPMNLRSEHNAAGLAPQGKGVIGPMLDLIGYEPGYEAIVRYLLGDVVLVENLESALSVWSGNSHVKTLVTLEGDVLEPQGVLTGGSLEGASAHLLQNKREIRELEDRLVGLEAEQRLLQDQQTTLKAEHAGLVASIEALRKDAHQGELAILDQQKDLHHLVDDLRQTGQKIEILGREAERFLREIESMKVQRLEAQRGLERMEADQADLEAQVRQSRGLHEQERRKLAGLSEELTTLKVQAAATTERRESALRNRDHLVRIRADLDARIERLQSEITEGNLKAVQARERIEACRVEVSGLLGKREREQAELSAVRDSYERLAAKVREAEMTLKEHRAELLHLTQELASLATREREREVNLEHLLGDIQRSYRLDLASAVQAYHMLPPPGPEDHREADKLREELERMGDVNPQAVQQYEEHRERHDFLTTQSRDLEESLGKLEEIIQKINKTSRVRFKEAFDAIGAKFQEVFPRLFQGGVARLVLEENLDLLEAGVDIVVQPPGKKLQNIELLSGGEKALTAVALLFSIFLIKPTPFCLLDEVDAPLDDVNIGRFNAIVREMSTTSQFIIITHNKQTMELLQRLYGITMEEPGVSTIVRVELDRAEEVRKEPTPAVQAC